MKTDPAFFDLTVPSAETAGSRARADGMICVPPPWLSVEQRREWVAGYAAEQRRVERIAELQREARDVDQWGFV